MKFAISYSTPFNGTDPDRLVTFAQHAEACGFEALYLQDHIALYPGASYGAGELPPASPYFDPLDCLSFVAAVTQRLLLGTGVLLLPYRHPVVLAKRLATVDVLSKGRMRLLTVGLGTLPGEAQAVGVDFHTRGRRADEAIDVLRLLWSGGPDGVDHHGEFYAFDKLCSYPKPHGTTELPIHVGGSSRAAARRAGRRGDGYFAGGMLDDAERELQIELARKTAAEAGRDPAALEYTRWGPSDLSVEQVQQLEEQGVTRILVNLAPGTADEQHDRMSEFAERFDLTNRH
ncbi:TIGR03619 family F420-dependent LLM class oxidoreductase [Nocardia abscessus]|uniref:TIGR03619 family F420-dependent LLM class oxidoreductase n=1 Tax=Nocardia abscessus TaxID=120957 RepID=UPI001895C082|nr:TIGR03619 family F420-dependent LLM class oxidoreductase [Nocardia abscessus]MBF6341207.1 TIGR03619 family F420-dependent LLM class oxidoreductase [Nocardia abscessus]